MTFAELKTEFFNRGTSYLEESAEGVSRAERWLNQGYREILNHQSWPFLEVVVTGALPYSPLAALEIRKVRWVRKSGESGRPLKFATAEELVTEDGVDLTSTGTPEFWYFDSSVRVATYPVDTVTPYEVSYLRRVPQLVLTSDTPIFDEEYHNLIVDKAMVKAYEDSDNFAAARSLEASLNESLLNMTEDYQISQMTPRYIRVDPSNITDG